MTPLNGKLSDPEWRKERARKAHVASRTPQALIRALEKAKDQITEEDREALVHLVGELEGPAIT